MPCTIVVGAQWGDEGKGKIVDLLAEEHDVVVRFQGGANAGHSVIHGGKTHVLHLVPSGILRPGKRCVIGNGVVVDPKALLEELTGLERDGVKIGDRLLVSRDAHCILPFHSLAEHAREEGPNPVGTTRRGIGPTYEDKAARVGLRMGDLLDEEILTTAVHAVRARAEGRLHGSVELPSAESVIAECRELGQKLAPHLGDARRALWQALAEGRRVLLEGAQGTLLDLDHGTYPFVTSSSATAGGALTGSGLGPRDVDRVLGVAKAYTTRVGHGPFPTEFDEVMAARVREAGEEYGATTGRPRRCGWLDAVALRYAVQVNGLDALVVTKLDVLDGFERIAVATAYRTPEGSQTHFESSARRLEGAEPVYEWLPGWETPTQGVSRWEELPENARAYLERVEALVGCRVGRVSLGPEREATIPVPPPERRKVSARGRLSA